MNELKIDQESRLIRKFRVAFSPDGGNSFRGKCVNHPQIEEGSTLSKSNGGFVAST